MFAYWRASSALQHTTLLLEEGSSSRTVCSQLSLTDEQTIRTHSTGSFGRASLGSSVWRIR